MLYAEISDQSLLKELVKQLTVFNSIIKEISQPGSQTIVRDNCSYAFDPSAAIDKLYYQRNIRLMSIINDLLHENMINIKSQGYTYLRDALCIIYDLERLDVCLGKEVYPLIAEKYRVDNKNNIEHCIRNSVDSAYKLYRAKNCDHPCIMKDFEQRPSNKHFILNAALNIRETMLKSIIE